MNFGNFGTVEFQMLWLSVVLGLVQIALPTLIGIFMGRTPWAIGSRDETQPSYGKLFGRLDRAFGNFVETFAFFAAAVLLAHALGKHSLLSERGAELYFWSRVAYVPAYAFGISGVRTLIWIGSAAGIIMVLWTIYPG
jgi:uncharacterized MAPEG superfamily protein